MTWQTDQDALAKEGRMQALKARAVKAGISEQFFDKKKRGLASEGAPLFMTFVTLELFVEDVEEGRVHMTTRPLSPPVVKLYPLSRGYEPRRTGGYLRRKDDAEPK